jgi:hypothetical protein
MYDYHLQNQTYRRGVLLTDKDYPPPFQTLFESTDGCISGFHWLSIPKCVYVENWYTRYERGEGWQ